MKTIRNKTDDLQDILNGLKVGDAPVYDTVTNFEITRVPGGFIYKNEYVGMCFVPDVQKATVGAIKNSVAKAEPKKTITK